MIEEITMLSRRLSGATGTGISASKGKGRGNAYAVTRRALDRLGLVKLEDFRPVERQHLEHLRATCQQVANALYSSRGEKMKAAIGFATVNILLDALDDTITVEPLPKAVTACSGQLHRGR